MSSLLNVYTSQIVVVNSCLLAKQSNNFDQYKAHHGDYQFNIAEAFKVGQVFEIDLSEAKLDRKRKSIA